MEFFIPGSTKPEKCIKQAIENVTKQLRNWKFTDKRIYKLKHQGKAYTVGEIYRFPKRAEEQIILLILELITPSEKLYYVICTELRGFTQGFPVMIGKEYVTEIIEFNH